MSLPWIPIEIAELIVCYIGDERLYEKVFDCKYIRTSNKHIIEAAKKKKILAKEIETLFCRDFVHFIRLPEDTYKHRVNINISVGLFKALVKEAGIKSVLIFLYQFFQC